MTQAGEPGAPGPGGRPGRGGPPPAFFLIGLLGILLGLAVIVAQVLGGGADAGRAAAPPTMAPPGEPAAATRQVIAAALAAQGLQVTDPQTPYRPGESPALLSVPRRVVQVVLPQDPTHGFVVIYELPSPSDAARVGQELAAYLDSGPGKVQYPFETEFVIRRVDRTLVFFPWTPGGVVDERTPVAAAVLATLGEPISPAG